jgi:hypothetical protein
MDIRCELAAAVSNGVDLASSPGLNKSPIVLREQIRKIKCPYQQAFGIIIGMLKSVYAGQDLQKSRTRTRSRCNDRRRLPR